MSTGMICANFYHCFILIEARLLFLYSLLFLDNLIEIPQLETFFTLFNLSLIRVSKFLDPPGAIALMSTSCTGDPPVIFHVDRADVSPV